MERSRRNVPRVNYYNIHHGLVPDCPTVGMEDYINLFPEGDATTFDDEDAATIANQVASEEAELRELEAQAQAIKEQEEVKRKQQTLENLSKLQAMRERKAVLRKIIAGDVGASGGPIASRNSTPATTPVVQQPGEGPSTANRGEFNDIYNSILHLRHGNLAPFADIMANRANMEGAKTSSLPNLTNTGKGQVNLGHPSSRRNLNFGNASNAPITPAGVNDIAITSGGNANKSIVASNNEVANNGPLKAVAFANESVVKAGNQTVSKPIKCEEAESDEESEPKKGKKRKSGILTKPDEADIVQTVRFPHELLDDRHVKHGDKIFGKLNFNLLCAGELELIKRCGISPEEKEARIEILLTLCYHSSYLTTDELKAQYSATLQRIERGSAKWDPILAERLHNDLAFRASVSSREHDKAQVSKESKSSDKNTRANMPNKSDSKLPSENKIHYCADFNRGSCSFNDNHEGKLNNKDVTLWHVCKRCLLSDAKLKRLHPESDPECPSRL